MAHTVGYAGKRLFTLGQLAEEVRKSGGPHVSTHQLKYAIDQYGIDPITRVGILRVWTEDEIPRIKRALARIAQNRRGRW